MPGLKGIVGIRTVLQNVLRPVMLSDCCETLPGSLEMGRHNAHARLAPSVQRNLRAEQLRPERLGRARRPYNPVWYALVR